MTCREVGGVGVYGTNVWLWYDSPPLMLMIALNSDGCPNFTRFSVAVEWQNVHYTTRSQPTLHIRAAADWQFSSKSKDIKKLQSAGNCDPDEICCAASDFTQT